MQVLAPRANCLPSTAARPKKYSPPATNALPHSPSMPTPMRFGSAPVNAHWCFATISKPARRGPLPTLQATKFLPSRSHRPVAESSWQPTICRMHQAGPAKTQARSKQAKSPMQRKAPPLKPPRLARNPALIKKHRQSPTSVAVVPKKAVARCLT